MERVIMKKTVFLAMILSIAFGCQLRGVDAAWDSRALCSKSDAAKDTIAQINHLNWVVNTIKTHKNVIALEDAYREISPDRLNLNRIPDQSVMNEIMDMLNLLHEMIKDDLEIRKWRQLYEMECRLEETKTSVYRLGMIKDSFSPDFSLGLVSRTCDTFINNYVRTLEVTKHLKAKEIEKKFEIESAKLARLHELNKKLLQKQWEMIKEYGFDDFLRVSDADIACLIDELRSADPGRVYPRIEAMRERFLIFPRYWCHLATVAYAAGANDVALDACNRFFEVNRGLLRYDESIATVAMIKAALTEKNEKNRDEIIRLLGLIEKHGATSDNWEMDCFCATLYHTYLNDDKSAMRLMRHAVATLENSIVETIGFEGELENELDKYDVAFADGEKLWRCRRMMEQMEKNSLPFDEAEFLAFSKKMTTSVFEKLQHLERTDLNGCWNTIADDVNGVDVKYANSFWNMSERGLMIGVPLKWFMSGAIPIRVDVLEGGKSIFECMPSRKELKSGKIVFAAPGFSNDIIGRCDALNVTFKFDESTIVLTYASGAPYKKDGIVFADSKWFSGDNFKPTDRVGDLRLMTVSVNGREYFYQGEGREFSSVRSEDAWKDLFSKTFPGLRRIASGRLALNTNGVEYIEIKENNDIQVHYRNDGENTLRPAVSLYLLNEYGAVVAQLTHAVSYNGLPSGAEQDSATLKGWEGAKYICVLTKDISEKITSVNDAKEAMKNLFRRKK